MSTVADPQSYLGVFAVSPWTSIIILTNLSDTLVASSTFLINRSFRTVVPKLFYFVAQILIKKKFVAHQNILYACIWADTIGSSNFLSGDAVPDLTGPRIETQTSRTDCDVSYHYANRPLPNCTI